METHRKKWIYRPGIGFNTSAPRLHVHLKSVSLDRDELIGVGDLLSSRNLCPKCHKPIRLPEEDIVIVKMKTGLRGQQEDRMVHRLCPGIVQSTGAIASQDFCSQCTHPATVHNPKCEYSGYGYKCDCGKFKK